MRLAATISAFAAATGRALTLLAALAFVVSGMASIHTSHALAGGHDRTIAQAAGSVQHAASHCDPQDQQAPHGKQDKAASCCAFACAPLVVLTQPPAFAVVIRHGDVLQPSAQAAILDRAIDGLFRPPRTRA